MNKKKILICGATGFIGRNIAEYFSAQDEYEVYGTYLDSTPFLNNKIQMVKVDLRDSQQVEGIIKGKDIVIQAAATTSGAKDIVNTPHYHVTDNAVMNSLIFRSAFENKVSNVIFFSCTVMYQSGDLPVREIDFDANQDIYSKYFGVGWTKVYIEKMCQFYASIGSTKFTAIRHSNIYGPHDKYDLEKSHVFGATVTKIMNQSDGGKIIVWGSGEEERDLLYISDLVNFVDLVIKKQKDKFVLLNVGLGESISVKDLVNKIIRVSGKRITIDFDLSKPTIKTKLCLDCTKAKEILGWVPAVTLDEGIKKTIEWYRTDYKITASGGEK